jgi:Mg2+ and Co2+ transporter CorA
MIQAYLYDAKGKDREVDLSTSRELPTPQSHQLLWVEVVGRDGAELDRVAGLLRVDQAAMSELLSPTNGQGPEDFDNYFRFAAVALGDDGTKPDSRDLGIPKKVRLDFVVGDNWLVTIADEELTFLREFRAQDRGETLIGALSSAALAASLLDWHLTRYLESFERLEAFVDALDVRILAGRSLDRSLLRRVMSGRRFVASLRRALSPQRSVYYGLSRPDFVLVAKANATEHFKQLEHRFERAIDALEHGRELVQGSFDLYATRVAENTNTLVRRITFASIILGAVGAVAGIFGMNFQTPYTASGTVGFWTVVGTLIVLGIGAAAVSRLKNWI